MRTALRAAYRLALAGCFAVVALSLVAGTASAAAPPEKTLPDTTFLFVKIENAAGIRDAFAQTQFGQLWNDTALKAWKDSVADQLDEASKDMKSKVGVSIRELVELPQGTVSLAVLGRDDPKMPVALVLTIDAGKNADRMADVLTKATKQGEESGGKVETQEYKGLKIQIIQTPKKDDDKAPPLIWTQNKSLFTIGTDLAVIKELIENAEGRADSLAAAESFVQAQKKFGSESQIVWYVDVGRVVKLITQVGAANQKNAGQAQQTEAILQVLGINGLKALAGSVALNVGNYDSLTKTVILAPAPVQGVLKMFKMPKAALRPEPWVPASVSGYQTISWDLDAAFAAVNEIVNMFAPGTLNAVEQQLVGPNGGEPLSFQRDIFGPLGNRLTMITDYKKPIKEDSQRALLAVALSDSKAFERTLKKLIALTNSEPKKREFQGVEIYDFPLPNMGAQGGNNVIKGNMSLAVAKDTFFLSSEPTLLEAIIRGGGTGLADNVGFQEVAKELPSQVSSMSYNRPDEQARISYDMIKSGAFTKAIKQAGGAGGAGDLSKLTDLLEREKDKLPDFSVFAKYLSQGGGYSVADEDGTVMTSFTLRKAKP